MRFIDNQITTETTFDINNFRQRRNVTEHAVDALNGDANGGVGGQRSYNGMQLVDQIVTNKSVRVVAAQTTPSATAASPKAPTPGIQEPRL